MFSPHYKSKLFSFFLKLFQLSVPIFLVLPFRKSYTAILKRISTAIWAKPIEGFGHSCNLDFETIKLLRKLSLKYLKFLNGLEFFKFYLRLRVFQATILKIGVETNFLCFTIGVHHTCFLVFGHFFLKEIGFPLQRNHVHKIKRI